uniref:Uncharacterized protein n=1 Tax=Lactuca sativa TaxID=4236 RepID=A0A9R1V8Y4_LACSA|nr:hypothetical protein LSAT_V11C600324370 [Lactuca sativa]
MEAPYKNLQLHVFPIDEIHLGLASYDRRQKSVFEVFQGFETRLTTKRTKIRYECDEESNDDLFDLGLLDVEPDNFNPRSNLCGDPFLNILWGDKADVDDIHREEHEHEHLEDENELEVGVEFRVHDPTVKWNKMKPIIGELHDSHVHLRFALTNYVVANGYQLMRELTSIPQGHHHQDKGKDVQR